MKQLPDEQTLQKLLAMGKDLEDRARKVYQISEAIAQKYKQQSMKEQQSSPKGITIREK